MHSRDQVIQWVLTLTSPVLATHALINKRLTTAFPCQLIALKNTTKKHELT